MFCDIKNMINDDEVKTILAYCMFDNSSEGLQKKIKWYLANPQLQLYSWVEDGIALGVVGFEVHDSRLEIHHIAVSASSRRQGTGRKMISILQERYNLAIEAETDNEAVDFYRRCGFEITKIQKYNVTRYMCILKPLLTLLYGTNNEGKLNAMRSYLAGFPIRMIGLTDVNADLPEIDESGKNPLENAAIKALAYYKATKIPVFSCDSGLYIKDAPKDLQPGVHVRNIGGKYLNDDEMIEYYSRLADRFGGKMTVRYKNGICLVMNENYIFNYMGDDIASEEFVITSKRHEKRTPGFPLDSLSVHIKTGKYYYDIGGLKDRVDMEDGFREFFKRALKIGEIVW